jgi:lysophospholipase L1-like esterase
VTVIVGAEVFARYYLGLGTPPITITHPTIEYMYKPNQDVYRFGNHMIINQYGMRSMPFNVKKGNGEFRVVVFGDSIVNGGTLTDHKALATTILQNTLQDKFSQAKKNVTVGNISAGSWGPGNWLAYANEYGFFGSDIVVLVISSGDAADNPTFEPLNKNIYATKTPVSALLEGITIYLPQIDIGEVTKEPDRFEEKPDEREVKKALGDLRGFLQLAKKNSSHVLVFQNWEKSEIEKGFADPGNQRIREVCESMGISSISLEPYFRRSIDKGINPYRDNVHSNPVGQRLIAEAILENLPNTVLYQSDKERSGTAARVRAN